MIKYKVRIAQLSDVDEMSFVHVTSWQETYKGLLDNQLIEKFSLENRQKMWTAFLQKDIESQRAYVAIISGKIVGIASWQEEMDHIELVTLYVLAEFQSLGIGKALFKQTENDAAKRDKYLTAWVLKGNKAVSFYEKNGFKTNQV